MGTMLVTYHQAGQPGGGTTQPVIRLPGATTERVTTSGTSARTTGAAPQGPSGKKTDGGFATVFAIGANLFVVSGTGTPTAAYPAAGASGNGSAVLSGQSITFAVKPGEKIAAIEFT